MKCSSHYLFVTLLLCGLSIGKVSGADGGQCTGPQNTNAQATYSYHGNLYDVNRLHMVNEDLEAGVANDWCEPSIGFSVQAKEGTSILGADSYQVVLVEKDHQKVMIRNAQTCDLVTLDANTSSLALGSYIKTKIIPCSDSRGVADNYLHEKYIQRRMVVDSFTAQNAIIHADGTIGNLVAAAPVGRKSGRRISSVKQNVDYGAGYLNEKKK